MFENYTANSKDLRAIEEGIKYVWHPKLNFIFKNKKLIEKVVIVSYDSKSFYLWKHGAYEALPQKATKVKCALPSYELFKISHKLKIGDNHQLGWSWGFILKNLTSLDKLVIPPDGESGSVPVISGALLKPFLISQKRRSKLNNPYTTPESYLATIIHEFGHAYFHQKFSWWFANKEENLAYLKKALNLYAGKKERMVRKINVPNYGNRLVLLSETFAFCADYSASSIFWKKHRADIDVANIDEITKLIAYEKKKNLLKENSVLDPDPSAHNAALVIGKILINSAPKSWPQKLLSANYIQL